MPTYDWRCQVCDAINAAAASQCTQCTCPAEVNALEIDARREQLGLNPSAQHTKSENHTPSASEYEVKRRADGSNIVPLNELARTLALSLGCLFLAWRFFKDEKATFSFGRHAHTIIEVSGFFSSLLGTLAMLTLASTFLSIFVDHFDRRQNEHHYKAYLKYGTLIFIGLALLTFLVGLQFEHIRVVPR